MQQPTDNIDQIIQENAIPEADTFKCPFCNKQHYSSQTTTIMYGNPINREDDPGFDFKEILVCPTTHKFYWYLNGV